MVLSLAQSIPGYLIHTAFSWAARLVGIWKLFWCGCSEILVCRSLTPWWWRSQGDNWVSSLTVCRTESKESENIFNNTSHGLGAMLELGCCGISFYQVKYRAGCSAYGSSSTYGDEQKGWAAPEWSRGNSSAKGKKTLKLDLTEAHKVIYHVEKLGRIVGHVMKWSESQNKYIKVLFWCFSTAFLEHGRVGWTRLQKGWDPLMED